MNGLWASSSCQQTTYSQSNNTKSLLLLRMVVCFLPVDFCLRGNAKWQINCQWNGLLYLRPGLVFTVRVKNSPPPDIFLTFSQNGWEYLIQILYAYSTFLSTLDYQFLFNYLQLRRSYAILSATTIICSKCPSVETHTGWSHLIWHNFVTIRDNSSVWENVIKCQRAFRPMVDILNIWCELGGRA